MTDVWQYLRGIDRPIVMYGTGNGADRIFLVFDRLGITVSAIFASDGFVRSRTFHGIPVVSYADVLKKYGGDFIIVLAFGSDRQEVVERFYQLDGRHELYAPDVPVAGEELFDADFFEKNREKIEAARDLFSDSESLAVYDDVINYRLTGKIGYLKKHGTGTAEIMTDILKPEGYRTALDLGAYTGDTARELIAFAPSLETVIALEPDPRNFAKLAVSSELTGKIEPHLAAAWNRRDLLTFTKGGGRGIHRTGGGKTVEIAAAPADSFLCGRIPDYIKIDVEGAENEAIDGCRGAMSHSPDLKIAVYHRSRDIFDIPMKIHGINPDYRMFLRKAPSVPGWDVDLVCTVR